MPTNAPIPLEDLQHNEIMTRGLWGSTNDSGRNISLGGTSFLVQSRVGITGIEPVVKFIENYKWLDNATPADIRLLVQFLKVENHGINDFAIVAPQRQKSFGKEWQFGLTVKNRSRRVDKNKNIRGFQLYGEPNHRRLARELASHTDLSGPSVERPNSRTKKLTREGRGVILIYPVREEESGPVSIGFEIALPPNDLPYGLQFTTRVEDENVATVSGD